jgi:hypothetical protein
MPATPLPNYGLLQRLREPHFAQVWNALIPASAVKFEVIAHGVRYLHATKGWKFVSAKRFAIRGVM